MEDGRWKMENEEAASLSALSSILAGCEIFVLFVVDPSGFEKSVFIRVHPWLYVLGGLAVYQRAPIYLWRQPMCGSVEFFSISQGV
jgi:hypothetical protein